ncbi:MAG TPA: thioredoxin domain-containing protein [Thermoanaerobaculia bacterium]|nr:thioredoxin domain-containing protein [Thermoanaerobaculia bacterium]
MRRFVVSSSAFFLLALPMFAQVAKTEGAAVPLKSGSVLAESLPRCEGAVVKHSKFDRSLPSGMQAELVTVESTDANCTTTQLDIRTTDGREFVGAPWFLEDLEGSPEERIKAFAWKSFNETFSAEVDKKLNEDGFYNVRLYHVTEHGKVKVDGLLDRSSNIFFMGHFYRTGDDLGRDRMQRLQHLFATTPARGPANAPVTVIEFSDLQCPSCKRATGYVDPILERYKGKVRFIRVDLPLISAHPWAFSAAVMGRAIYKQSPDAFWQFKKAVYDSQSDLNIFSLTEFAKGFVQDHDLDAKRFAADVDGADVPQEILDSIGTAFTIGIQSTPSYIVNGELVASGKDGDQLDKYIAEQLKKAKPEPAR